MENKTNTDKKALVMVFSKHIVRGKNAVTYAIAELNESENKSFWAEKLLRETTVLEYWEKMLNVVEEREWESDTVSADAFDTILCSCEYLGLAKGVFKPLDNIVILDEVKVSYLLRDTAKGLFSIMEIDERHKGKIEGYGRAIGKTIRTE